MKQGILFLFVVAIAHAADEPAGPDRPAVDSRTSAGGGGSSPGGGVPTSWLRGPLPGGRDQGSSSSFGSGSKDGAQAPGGGIPTSWLRGPLPGGEDQGSSSSFSSGSKDGAQAPGGAMPSSWIRGPGGVESSSSSQGRETGMPGGAPGPGDSASITSSGIPGSWLRGSSASSSSSSSSWPGSSWDSSSDASVAHSKVECYECSSSSNPGCGDPFSWEAETAGCNGMCSKMTYMQGGMNMVTRGCLPHGTEAGDLMDVCGSHYCNAATTTMVPVILLISTTTAMALFSM